MHFLSYALLGVICYFVLLSGLENAPHSSADDGDTEAEQGGDPSSPAEGEAVLPILDNSNT